MILLQFQILQRIFTSDSYRGHKNKAKIRKGSSMKRIWIKGRKRGSGFLRIFTVAFLLV